MNPYEYSSAEEAYASAHVQATSLASQIMEGIEDMDAPSEKTDWADVGDMMRLVSQLREIVESRPTFFTR